MIPLNTSFVESSTIFFKDVVPVFCVDDINLAISAIQGGKWEEFLFPSANVSRDPRECACYISVWSCLAIGAALQGCETEARIYSMKAVLASSMLGFDVTLSNEAVLSMFRAEMQFALYCRLSGQQQVAMEHFSKAEEVGSMRKDASLQGHLKACKLLGFFSNSQILEAISSLLFSEAELNGFPLDSKIYLKWSIPFFHNILLEVEEWEMKFQCYTDIQLAEKYLHNISCRSPLNWSRVQFLLLALELGYLSTEKFANGIERARRHACMFLGNLNLLNTMKYSEKGYTEVLMRLELLAFTFHQIKDFEHYAIIKSVWNSLPSTKHENPLLALSEMKWEGFTDDPLRNALRIHIQERAVFS